MLKTMNIATGHRTHRAAFHFQPCAGAESMEAEGPLLFTSSPPCNQGRVTLFFRTRRTLRRRMGVHDLGELDGVLNEKDAPADFEQMQRALDRVTNWNYLFPEPRKDESGEPATDDQFQSVLKRTLG